MLAGGCIAHRSKAHKSVMLSSAAAEYYEASEGCRELIYVRGILEDFYGQPLPPTPMYINRGTKFQLADIGTKALPAPVFLPLQDVILGKVSFSDLQGL